MSKISRGQKGEEQVIKVLSDVKEYHHLLNNITLMNYESGMSHQLDHILIHPHGIFVIETKNYFGDISYNPSNKKWTAIVKGNSKYIGDPLLQNKSHAVTLYKALKGRYKIIPVVVFAKNNAPYMDDENIINIDDLLLFIDSYPYEHKMTDKSIDKIKEQIEAVSVDMSINEHVENISYLKQIKKELYLEKEYAIEKGICPRCNSKMLTKGYTYICSKCDFKFKL